MRAILIDPFKQEVKEINLNKENLLQELYDTIGCSYVEKVSIGRNIDIIVDEEGLYKETPAFQFGPQIVLHGRAVIVNVDVEEGEWIDTDVSVGLVEKITTHIPTELAQAMKQNVL